MQCVESPGNPWVAKKELTMIAKMTLAAGVLTLGLLIAPQISTATTFTPVPGVVADDSSLVETVRGRGRCRAWRG
jgi:hypothetical protein